MIFWVWYELCFLPPTRQLSDLKKKNFKKICIEIKSKIKWIYSLPFCMLNSSCWNHTALPPALCHNMQKDTTSSLFPDSFPSPSLSPLPSSTHLPPLTALVCLIFVPFWWAVCLSTEEKWPASRCVDYFSVNAAARKDLLSTFSWTKCHVVLVAV